MDGRPIRKNRAAIRVEAAPVRMSAHPNSRSGARSGALRSLRSGSVCLTATPRYGSPHAAPLHKVDHSSTTAVQGDSFSGRLPFLVHRLSHQVF